MSEQEPRFIHLEATHSTNQYLRELHEKEPLGEGSVVLADYQTAGKGQTGNSWESAPGENLTFSLLLCPGFLPANRQFLISQITALALKAALDAYTTGITIKWPNDIYWNEQKICGMLIENDLSGHHLYSSIIGIGLNVNQTEFHSDAPNPVSLRQITCIRYEREAVLNAFIEQFTRLYLLLMEGKEEKIRDMYRAALFRGDGFYLYRDNEGIFEASIRQIEPTGHLILQLHTGEQRRYAFKEVAVVLNSIN